MKSAIINRKISFSDPSEMPFLCPSGELFGRAAAPTAPSFAPSPNVNAVKEAAMMACGGGGGGG